MKTVTTNQFAISVFYLVLATKLFTLLPNLFYYSNNDAVFAMLLCFFVDFLIFLFVIIIVKTNPNTTFSQFLCNAFGKIFGKIFMAIFYVFIAVKLCFLIGETYTFFLEFLFEKMHFLLFLIPLFFVTGYLAFMGEKTIARTMEIFVFLVAIGLFLTSITATDTLSGDTLAPFFQNGISPVLDAAKHSAFYFGNGFMLLFFMGKVDISKNFLTKSNISLVFSFLFLILLGILFFEAYGQSVSYVDFAIGDLPKYNPFVSDLGRLNWLNVVVCSSALFLQISFYIYGLNQLTKSVFNTKKEITCTIFNCFIIALCGFIFRFSLPYLVELVNFVFSDIALYASILGIIVCIFAIIKGEKHAKNSKI